MKQSQTNNCKNSHNFEKRTENSKPYSVRRQIELTCLLLPSFQFRLFILTPNKCTQFEFEFDCVLYVNQKMKNVGLLFVVLQFFFLNIGRDGKQISMGFNADRKISF